jgi:hypothetical protein
MSSLAALAILTDPPIQVKVISSRERASGAPIPGQRLRPDRTGRHRIVQCARWVQGGQDRSVPQLTGGRPPSPLRGHRLQDMKTPHASAVTAFHFLCFGVARTGTRYLLIVQGACCTIIDVVWGKVCLLTA